MSDKVQTSGHQLSAAAKALVLRELKKGDQARIAEMVGTTPDYVKKVFRQRARTANSALANRIWLAGHRMVRQRREITKELRPC